MKKEYRNEETGWNAVASHYGLSIQLVKLTEEVGELMEAYELNSLGLIPHSKVITEIADVYALSEQIAYLLGDRTGELDDLVERAEAKGSLPLLGSRVVIEAARMSNGITARRCMLRPLADLIKYLRRYCQVSACEERVVREKARKLKRVKKRIEEENNGT